MSDIIIQCPKCLWQPDGEIYWMCNCGHRWNTFLTRAKCPNCNRQWEETYCPGCHNMVPHADWYTDPSSITPMTLELSILIKKRIVILNRLKQVGIRHYPITHLDYLDHREVHLRDPREAGVRMMILSAVSYAAESPDEKLTVIQWMKQQGLWDSASEKEIAFLHNLQSTPDEIVQMSWRSEAAYTLAWCLRLIDTLPPIDRGPTDDEIEKFHNAVPAIGSTLSGFLDNLEFRPVEEIYEENIVNELVTSYLRDLMITGKPNLTTVIEDISIERHYVLNWLRFYGYNADWDEVDTST